MNLLDCYVTKVTDKPYFKYGVWNLNVEDTCYGRAGNTTLQFKTEEEALSVKEGYHFLA